ncbi:hypothetical protein C8R46DRAFT_1300299 [Mycena filopes]|nr:hypothetical protein C8R46DRAFT_1300299 [Mycena filopes]
MSVDAVLQLQELCDEIAQYLDSKWDLWACTLISRAFTSSAQRQLFHDIILNRGTLDFDDLSVLDGYDESRASRQLCAVLETSPHLLPYIRRIRPSLEVGVLTPLAAIQFPNLHDLGFHRRHGVLIDEESIALAAQLIGTPTVHRVGLLSLRFHNLHHMARLFAEYSPALESVFVDYLSFKEATLESERPPLSRVRVKTLSWGNIHYAEPKWMFEPSSPLDLSALTQLNLCYGGPHGSTILTVVERARHSLRQLTIDARKFFFSFSFHDIADGEIEVAMSPYYDATPRPALLADLPALQELTLITTVHECADVVALLAALPHHSALRALTLQIRRAVPFKPELMRALGVACAESLPLACVVTVHLLRFAVARALDHAQEEQPTREVFAELEAGGRLRVVL